jgi:hypothetical protein
VQTDTAEEVAFTVHAGSEIGANDLGLDWQLRNQNGKRKIPGSVKVEPGKIKRNNFQLMGSYLIAIVIDMLTCFHNFHYFYPLKEVDPQ